VNGMARARAVWHGARRRSLVAVASVACCAVARPGHAETPHATIDRTAVRFYAPETGGTAYPRFIFGRTLAFEARLIAMADGPEGIGESYDERDVREALEHHVAEDMLSSLADRLIADSTPDKRPTAGDLEVIERDVGGALVERIGGRERVDGAARAERVDRVEVNAILRRGAMAAWYIDRAVTPILHPSEEQLRDVLRTSAHPYRGQPFERVRVALERWFVVERVHVAEGAFLQQARSRVRIIVTP
jgi:hypothetical protein